MRKTVLSIILFGFVALAVLAGYHLLSPKIVLVNESGQEYEEFVVKLPASCVSIGPILPGTEQTIYYSFQDMDGTIAYALRSQGREITNGSFSYYSDGELARTIRFVINVNGDISFDTSG